MQLKCSDIFQFNSVLCTCFYIIVLSVYNFRFSLFFLYLVFCVSVKVKLTVPLLCVCVHFARKGRPRNDLYSVGWDVKPYLLTYYYSVYMGNGNHC